MASIRLQRCSVRVLGKKSKRIKGVLPSEAASADSGGEVLWKEQLASSTLVRSRGAL